MIPQEFRIRLGKFLRQSNRLAIELREIVLQNWLRKKPPKMLAQDDTQFVIKSDKSVVERRVVKRRKAETIARIQPVIRKFAPRLDMARHKQTRDANSANAASHPVGVENRLAEKLLATPDFDGRKRFGRASWCDQSSLIALEEIYFLIFVLREQVMQQLLALCSELRNISLKFIPHLPVLLGRTRETFDSPARVEPGRAKLNYKASSPDCLTFGPILPQLL
jgi:hypothetical protein